MMYMHRRHYLASRMLAFCATMQIALMHECAAISAWWTVPGNQTLLQLQHSLILRTYDRLFVLPCHVASCRYLSMASLDLLNKDFTLG